MTTKRRTKPAKTQASKRRTKLAKAIADMMTEDRYGKGSVIQFRRALLYRDWTQRVEKLLKKWKV